MVFSVVSISSDSSKESVGTSTARVILFGTIPTTVPATAPTVDLPIIHDDTPLIATDTPTISPIVPTIPPIAPTIKYTSLFVCTDSSDSDTSERSPLQDPYEVIVARGRSRVAARSSPPSPPPIPVGRPYHTWPNGVLKMLTAKKRVGPLPTHRLALRYSADYYASNHFTSDDSSRDSPSDSSYSPTATSARPSRKRSRSPTASALVASPVPGALSPVRADLLPPRKRIRDSDFVTSFKVILEVGFVSYVPREIGLGIDVE
ncbi:hypothetical protein Tco_1450683, partial [Tanacetum coccineum]